MIGEIGYTLPMKTINEKIRWGVLGAANIAQKSVIPAAQKSRQLEITAIASRSEEKAQEAAEFLGIKNYYGSYEALLQDPDIDALYIPLPNHLHAQWAIAAMEAGKHVLCEKPIALSLEEIDAIIRTRDKTGMKIGEAFMVKSHPQWEAAVKLKNEGVLGTLTGGQGSFTYYNDNPQNVRNMYNKGGGGLWDIGVYPVFTSRLFFGEEPESVCAIVESDPQFGIDRLASAILKFPSGQFSFICGTQTNSYQHIRFFGTKGTLEIPMPFNPSPTEKATILLSGTKADKQLQTISFDAVDQYTLELEAFSEAIRTGREVPVPLENSRHNTAVILALFRAAEQGKWETV
ncbi:Gfo/Idh/MocA family protein [Sediminispirochaeta smaragdinae]|nr:Gfo/Idh/MocA family oxidoreductase [Sediminispirochaeta smaragdinae]